MTDKNEETYTVKATCSNCEWQGEVDIPKGTPVEDHSCPQCGCSTLMKD